MVHTYHCRTCLEQPSVILCSGYRCRYFAGHGLPEHRAELALCAGVAIDTDDASGASIALSCRQAAVVHLAERREFLLPKPSRFWKLATHSLVVVPLATQTRLGRRCGGAHRGATLAVFSESRRLVSRSTSRPQRACAVCHLHHVVQCSLLAKIAGFACRACRDAHLD